MKSLPFKKAWSRWLHLACGVPVEHVALVLGLAPAEVASLATAPRKHLSDDQLDHRHRLRSQGLSCKQIAADLDRTRSAIWHSLKLPRPRPKSPTGPPRKRPSSAILGQCGRYVRAFRDLGYSPERIAELFALDPSIVQDFLGRLAPRRPPRKTPDHLTRPRTRREENDARLAIQRAEAHRQRRAEARRNRREDERIARLQVHRSPEDAWGPRGTSTEIAEHARFLQAVRDGRLSSAALLGLASRVYHAEPRSRPPEPEPVVWTGASGLYVTPTKLTAEQILEAADRLRSGEKWARVAGRFGVSENTLRRYIKDIAPRRTAAEYPTAAVCYPHGTVRWDLPLGTTSDGIHRTVLVECECGAERRIWTTAITRPGTSFTGKCYTCHRHAFLDRFRNQPSPQQSEPTLCACGCGRVVMKKGSRFVKGHHRAKINAADAAQARRLHADGQSAREIARRYGMSEDGMYKVLSGRTRVIGSPDPNLADALPFSIEPSR